MATFRAIILFCLFLSVQNIFAQSYGETPVEYVIKDSVVVVGNRYKIQLKHEANTFRVIPQKEISDIAKHSVLEMVDLYFPSSFVLDKKVMGYGVGSEGGGSLNLRGLGGKPNTGILVLVNGHPDLMGIFGHPLPDVYGMDGVQKIEILAGAASTVFGSNAQGGVINIVTKPDYNQYMKLSFEAGAFNTYKTSLNLSRKFGNAGAYFTITRKSSDGHIPQSEFHSYNLQGGVEYQLNPVFNLILQGRYVPYNFDDPSRIDDTSGLGTYANIKRGMGELILENKGESISGSTQIYTNQGKHKFYDGFESNDFSYGFSTYQQIDLTEQINLAVGADITYYGGKANYDDQLHSLTNAGTYLLGLYSPTSELNLKFGLRYQYNSLPINHFSPVAGVSYLPIPALRLYANFQTGFRFPTIRELYLFPSSNKDLQEEKVNSFETGAEYFINNNISLQLTYYRNSIDEMISLVPNQSPPPQMMLINSGNAEQWGVESQLNIRFYKNISGQLSYSYLEPDNLTAFNPRQQVKYILKINYNNWHTALFGRFVNQLYADNNSESPLPDYHLMNLRLGYSFAWGDASIKLLNLLNKKYYVLPDYEAPPFYIMAGMNFFFN